jgi:hypothetical protein
VLDGSLELRVRLRDDLNIRVVPEPLDHLRGESPTELAHTGHEVQRFNQDNLRGHDGSRL